MLETVPALGQQDNEQLLKSICKVLKPQIYLPFDYIIYKDDIGEEMYFLVEGVVHVLRPDGKKIAAILEIGSYFGEMAILTDCRRICSVIAATYCTVYALHKNDLKDIYSEFPKVLQDFKEQAARRIKQNEKVINNNRNSKANSFFQNKNQFSNENINDNYSSSENEDEKDNQILKTLDELSALSPQLISKKTGLKSDLEKLIETIDQPIGQQKFGLQQIYSYDQEKISEEEKQSESGIEILHVKQKSYIDMQSLMATNCYVPKDSFKRNMTQRKTLKQNQNESSIFDEMERITKLNHRKMPKDKNLRRRLSQLSLGKELVLSHASNLKMQWRVRNQASKEMLEVYQEN